MRRIVTFSGSPPEWLVHDELTRCPYLPAQTARLPLRLPLRRLRGDELSRRLNEGDRRQGVLLYRPHCPSCSACEAIRIDVDAFEPSKTQRRIFRRGEALLRTEIGRPRATHEKVALYNRHKTERGLLTNREHPIDAEDFAQFLVETCTDSIELSYRCDGALVGVALCDRAADALSAVYCFYDPSRSDLSTGTYSILKQIALSRAWGLRYVYLGLYVAGCKPMAYKTQYLPHERLIGGAWRRFDRQPSDGVSAPRWRTADIR